MFLIDGQLHWSASDLTAAAECEYGLLRTLDYKLRWPIGSRSRKTCCKNGLTVERRGCRRAAQHVAWSDPLSSPRRGPLELGQPASV